MRIINVVSAFLLAVCSGLIYAQNSDDLSVVISKLGKPDRIVSSEYEKPRPPIVTKQIIYKAENVRAVFVPNALMGTPPPYTSWKFVGFQDQKTNQVISVDEVTARMKGRRK